MKIEYLIIKPKDDFCTTPDKFLSLLSSNSRLGVKDNQISFQNESFPYSLDSETVEYKNRKEIVFHFIVCSEKNEPEGLENIDGLLHRINSGYGNPFIINTIWDDVSIYYAKDLFPKIIETENLLRCVIYRFMIRIAGSGWFTSNSPDGFQDAIKKTYEKNDVPNELISDQLYYADFIQLRRFFFEPYSIRKLSQDLISSLRQIDLHSEAGKNKIDKLIETYESKSNWERYFSRKMAVQDLDKKWDELYKYRNSAAHSKRIRKKDADAAQGLIEELQAAFDICLNNIGQIELSDEEIEAVKEHAAETAANTQSSYENGTYTALSELSRALENGSVTEMIQNINRPFQQFFDNYQKICDSVKKAQETRDAIINSDSVRQAVENITMMQKRVAELTEPLLDTYAKISSAYETYQRILPDYSEIISPTADMVKRLGIPDNQE